MKNPSHERRGSLITPLPRASLLSTKSLSTAISPPSHSIRTPRKGTTSSDQPPPPAISPNVEQAHHSQRLDCAARNPLSQPKERVAGTTQPRELSSPAPARYDWCAAGERWAEIANLAVFLDPGRSSAQPQPCGSAAQAAHIATLGLSVSVGGVGVAQLSIAKQGSCLRRRYRLTHPYPLASKLAAQGQLSEAAKAQRSRRQIPHAAESPVPAAVLADGDLQMTLFQHLHPHVVDHGR